jgi:hypothetical protein
MTVTPPHLQALEEIERNGILGLVEILREEGIDAARYALWDATGWHRELPRRLGWLQSGSWNDWS